MKKFTKILALLLTAILALSVFAGCADAAFELMESLEDVVENYESLSTESGTENLAQPQAPPSEEEEDGDEGELDKNGSYTSKDEVAAYINLYGTLPQNFITKSQARDLGWDSAKGNLWDVAPGKSIGGDRFGNYENRLPKANGRTYYECDINYSGGYRGSERIIYSNDGLVYYTADHYETFTLLYKDGVKQ